MKYIKKNLNNLNLDSRSMRPVNFFEQIKERNEFWFKKNKSRIISKKTIFCILCSEKIEKVFLKWNKIYKILNVKVCKAYSANVSTGSISNQFMIKLKILRQG